MNIVCPKCRRLIPEVELDSAANVVFCPTCRRKYPLPPPARPVELDAAVDLNRPPKGAWFTHHASGALIGASHRSITTALWLLVLVLFWDGILSMFVFFALNSTLHLLHIPRPSVFPEPIMNGEPMGIGATLGLWLFLTPFMLIGAAFFIGLLSAFAGRTEVQLQPGEGILFTGIGRWGWRRRFRPELVKDVRLEDRSYQDAEGQWHEATKIVIEPREGKLIQFGGMLSAERRQFVAATLRRFLVKTS